MMGEDTVFSTAVAGCVAGSMVGIKGSSLTHAAGGCGAMAAMGALMKLAGEIRPEQQTVSQPNGNGHPRGYVIGWRC